MKKISIRLFTIFVFIFLLLSESVIFYTYYLDSKKTTENLLQENIKANILDLKHFLDKNLKKDNIDELTTYLDNKVNSNPLFDDIHIISQNKKLLYTTNRSAHQTHTNIPCKTISQMKHSNMYTQRCYTFNIRQYNRLTPYYIKCNVYLDTKYLHKIENKIDTFLYYSIGYFLFFFLLIWFVVKYIIIHPLEKLRQFAYYSTKVPKEFFISELESIRYSLNLTFKRLKKEQQDLYTLSTKDSLSGLDNRLNLIEKTKWLIAKDKRSHEKFALLFLDLDDFKNINDSLGHEFGDKILQHISKRLLKSVRENDIVARFGGDEFVVVLPDIEHHNTILEVVQRIMQEVSLPIVANSLKYHVTCSIGISIYPDNGNTITELLKNADIAMYQSKNRNKNNFSFFTKDLDSAVQEKIKIQELLIKALDENNFQLFYQPKVDIKTNKIIACEALIRLVDPDEGIIPPDKFIWVAEENGIIIPIGEWIIKEAVSQIKKWQNTTLRDIKVSVNLSAIQFRDSNLLQKIDTFTQDINRKNIDIELTESVLIKDFENRLEIIKGIKKLGISLSLDDFGTGYSSLSYLKNIPFDTLKIDKTFIDTLYTKDDLTFVNMIIGIADNLGLNVVAEGVETEGQLQLLKEINCEQYQGYLCSKPVEPKEFEELFNKILV